MSTKQFAVGVLVRDRIDLTLKTLKSLYHTDQDKDDYDLYILDNGSSPETVAGLKKWISGNYIPVKNMICMPSLSIGQAWNIFLLATEEYEYKVKVDNDIVFHGTPVPLTVDKPYEHTEIGETPLVAGVNPGAIPNASVVIGGNKRPSRRPQLQHSHFLDYLSSFSKQYKVDMVSLLALGPGEIFSTAMNQAAQRKYKNTAFIKHGCTLMTKKLINEIGYFDEQINSMVDVELSQRALKKGVNIGYHDSYWVYHTGFATPTCADIQRQKQEAMHVLDVRSPVIHSDTKWSNAQKAIIKEAKKHKIVNLV
jgi:hypothetical protein